MMQPSVFVFLLAFTLNSQITDYSRFLRMPASLSVSQTTEEDEYLQAGEQLFAAGDWAKAEVHFSNAAIRQPASPLWIVYLAVVLDKQGKSKEAHEKIKRLVAIERVESLLVFRDKSKTGKIVFVDTRTFENEKVGINRYVAALKMLKDEFKDREDELALIENRIKAIEDDVAGSNSTQNSKATQTKQEELRKLRRELERKKNETKAAFEKRNERVIGQVSEDIGKALDAYAQERNIAFMLDSSVFPNARFLTDKSIDVTLDFVTSYNALYPK